MLSIATLVVEGGKPIHAVDRTRAQPFVDASDDGLCVELTVERENFDATFGQSLGEGGADAAVVDHDHDAGSRCELHARGRAGLERWPDGERRHPPREPVRLGQIGDVDPLPRRERVPAADVVGAGVAVVVVGVRSWTKPMTWARVG